jgi:phosphatidate cytidylyltransferase
MSEMAKRWAVAGVGIPAVIGLLYLGGWPLAVPLATLAALGALEVYRIAEAGGVAPLAALGATAAAALVLLAEWRPTLEAFAPLALGLLGAVTALALVAAMRWRWPEGRPLGSVAITLFGCVYAGLALSVVPLLHALPETRAWGSGGGAPSAWGGLVLVALPLAATWLGDALALFAGTAWGKGGLAPAISPKKSWVGVWAGLAGAGFAAIVWYYVARTVLPPLPLGGPLVAAGVGVLLGALAVIGDLAESMLKREAGVKDSGTLFPGHGGVLDRLDALVFTLPAAYVVLIALD